MLVGFVMLVLTQKLCFPVVSSLQSRAFRSWNFKGEKNLIRHF